MELIVDDRERINIDMQKYPTKKDRIEVGDYCILKDGSIKICIERKTWADLAASFKDGRKENMNKLIAMREQTGCEIYYLIEGTPFKKSDSLIQGIPFKNLMSHLDRSQLRDGIHVIYCQNLADVLPRIYTLMDNVSEIITGGDEDNRQLLKEKVVKTDDEKLQAIWCSIKGISTKTADALRTAGVNLFDVYSGETDVVAISAIKYSSGRQIGDKKAIDIIHNVKNAENDILSSVNGISRSISQSILEQVTFSDLAVGRDVSEIVCGKKKLGKKMNQKIIDLFVLLRHNNIGE
jgi:ERCC4-type nuclease